MNTSRHESGTPEGRRGSTLYTGTGTMVADVPHEQREWPAGPRWRTFDGGPCLPPPPDDGESDRRLGPPGAVRQPSAAEVRAVNAAILLRRPLLVTGRPGVGKSGLAYRIARELRLGRVLQWPVTSRSTLTSGLYDFDVIGRAQAGQAWYAAQTAAADAGAQLPSDGAGPQDRVDIGEFVQLGPLGTAMLPRRLPRVLLIDEIDKCDADLPNDLLTLFEDGWFSVPPLLRVKSRTPVIDVHTADPGETAPVYGGLVRVHAFPIIIMTSNGERTFPEAFMRRALKFDIPDPDPRELGELVSAHFEERLGGMQTDLIAKFLRRRSAAHHHLSADQLLNAAHLATSGAYTCAEGDDEEWEAVLEAIWHPLRTADTAGEGD